MMRQLTHKRRFGSLLAARPLQFVLILAAVAVTGIIGANMVAQAQSQSTRGQLRPGQRLVTIYDNGRRQVVVTRAHTVRAALKQANIQLYTGDTTEPQADTAFDTTDFTVNIYRARPVLLEDNGRREWILSSRSAPRDIARHAGVALRPEDSATLRQSTDVAGDGAGLVLSITRAKPVTLVLYGQRTTVYTHVNTVDELLRIKQVNLTPSDTLSVERTAALTPGMTIEVWRNGVQTITEDQDIPFKTRQVKDADKDPSYKKLETAGKNGKRKVTFEVTMKNGKEVSRKEIQKVTTEEPVEQVEVVGTKVKYSGGPLTEEQITALGTCESGMTANRNSGNGFYGAFQFVPSTWHKVAPAPYNAGMPHEAPLDAQKQAVQNLLSKSSIETQFPGCAKKMKAQGVL